MYCRYCRALMEKLSGVLRFLCRACGSTDEVH